MRNIEFLSCHQRKKFQFRVQKARGKTNCSHVARQKFELCYIRDKLSHERCPFGQVNSPERKFKKAFRELGSVSTLTVV